MPQADREEFDESSPGSVNYMEMYTHNVKYDTSETQTSNGPHFGKYVDRRIGSQNPRWKYQVANGLDATTPFEGWKYTRSTRANYFTQTELTVLKPYYANGWETKVQTAWGTRARSFPGDPSGLSETKANNEALKQLVRKINSKQRTVQGTVFAGEMLQTIKLVTNPAGALRKGLDDYLNFFRARRKSIRKMKLREATAMARDTWLEYQLGWAPLLSEIDAGAQALAESHTKHWNPGFETVRALGVDENRTYQGKYQIPNAQLAWYETDMYTADVVEVRYISCIGVGGYQIRNNLHRGGFAPRDWLPSMWELIPYSFVIDYFTNIGTMIEAASLAQSSIRWTCKTVRRRKYNSFENWTPRKPADNVRNQYRILFSYAPSKGVFSEVAHVTRESYTGSLVPDFSFELPSPKQWLNVAALVDARRELKTFYR